MKYSTSPQALIASIALLIAPVAHSAVYVANNSGNWSNSGIWSPNSVPNPELDDITIDSGFSILADAVPPSSFNSVGQNNGHTLTITGAGSTLTSHDYAISHGSTTTVSNGGVLNLNGYLFGGNVPGGDPSVLNVDAATVYVALTPFGDPTPVRGFTGTQVGINSEFIINITNGGQYLIFSRESGWVKLGMTSGAIGTISVDGTGSIFSRDYSEPPDPGRVENITVGEVGGATGNLYLKNGGALTDNMNLVIAQNGGSTGNVIVGGDNNGAAGTGILTISKNIILGDGAGTFIQHDGTTTTGVAGVGGTFVVGFGNGSMSVATINGGAVNVGGELMIAQNGGSTGTVNLNGGTTSVDYVIIGGGTGALNFNGGVLRANKDEADFLRNISASNSEIQAGGVTFDSNGHNITIHTALDGAGGLTKDGLGALTLTGSGTYSGSTIVDGGTLIVGGSNVIPNASAVSIASGATLDLNGNNETIGSLTGAGSVTLGAGTLTTGGNNSDTTFSGVISESGSLVKEGSGVLILSGANSHTGSTTVSMGILNLQNNTALGTAAGGTSVSAGAAVQMQGGITIADEALTLSGGGIANDGALRNISGDNNYNGNITLGADTRINSDANTLTIDPASGNAISGGFALTVGGNGNVVIGGAAVISTLTKDGNGTLTLTDANTYAGSTSIFDGVVNIQHGDALGSSLAGTFVDAGAALQIQGGITVANESIFLNGTGVSNDGALRSMSGNNSFNGAITLGSDSRIHSDTVGDTLTIDPLSGDAISGGFNLTLGGAGNILIGGPVANGGTVTKTGTGTTTFTDANTYTGLTNINQGVLNIQNGSGLGASGSGTVVVDGSALQLQGNITVTGEALTISGLGVANDGALRSVSGNNSFNGNITLGSDSRINSDTIGNTLTIDPASGNAIEGAFDIIFGGAGNIVVGAPVANGGDVTKDGNGTLTFMDSNSYTGTTFINDGVLNVQNSGALGTTGAGTVVADGAALQLQGNIIITDEPLTISGMGVANDGALRSLSGDNSFNGNIILGADSRINSDTVGNTLTIDPALGNAISGAFDVFFGGAGNIFVGAPISNGGDLNKDGTGILTLDAINTYTGDTNIYNGTILIAGGGPINSNAIPDLSDVFIDMLGTFNLNNHNETIGSLSGSGNVILGSGTLTTGGNNADTTFSGSISGTGGLIKEGDGTFTLSGVNTYTGDTTVNDGVLIVTGSIVSNVNVGAGGTLGGNGTFGGTTTVSGVLGDPDSTGEMIFDGDLVLLGTAVLNMQIGGTLATQYDHLTLNANFTIDGTLNVTLINGFSPVPGDSFDLFDFNPLNTSGTFDAINLPSLPFDFTWDVSDLYDTGVLAVVPEPSTFGLLALGSVFALRRRRI